jgi:hypothetical protein
MIFGSKREEVIGARLQVFMAIKLLSSLHLLDCDVLWCCGRLPTFQRLYCLHFTLKMEAPRYSGTLVSYITTRYEKPEVQDMKLHNLYSMPNVVMVIKSSRMRWLKHVAHLRET